MSLPRFVAVPPDIQNDHPAGVIDLSYRKQVPVKKLYACFCRDIETAELIAVALNREVMQ